jgi:hypothetical protein
MADKDEEPILDFDETNGVVSGLDGDSDGEAEPHREPRGVFGQAFEELHEGYENEEEEEGA